MTLPSLLPGTCTNPLRTIYGRILWLRRFGEAPGKLFIGREVEDRT
jgi:hypothetical protein